MSAAEVEAVTAMRRRDLADTASQGLAALLLLLPLLAGLAGAGSFWEVYGWDGESSGAVRRAALWGGLARSVQAGLLAAGVALLLGVPAGWALSRRPRSALFLAVCALPLALAPSAAVSGWLHLFAPSDARSALRILAPGQSGPGVIFSTPGVGLVLGVSLWPVAAFETWPAFARARGETYSAALLAGSPARAFFRIVLPMCRGELAAAALLVFLLAAGDFTVSSLLLVRTLPVEVHDYLAQSRPGAAVWAALPLVALAGAGALLLSLRRAPTRQEARGAASPAALGRGWCGRASLALGLGLGFVLPMLLCLHGALPRASGEEGGWSARWTAGWPALSQGLLSGMSPFWVSFRLAAGAALLALVLGALRVACWPERSAPALRAAALLVLAAPGACLAGGLLLSGVAAAEAMEGGLGLNRPEALAPTGLLLALGFAARFIYLPLRLAEEGLRALDPAMLEAAELAGHGRFSRGLGVALPNVWPHLAAACGLVFVFSLGELAVADKLAPPGAVPLSVWLFQEQHLGYSEAVFGMSLALALAAAAALLLAGAAAGWLERAGEAALR